MSILTDASIREAMADGAIVITPFRDECLGTNSYDVHLGQVVKTYVDAVLDCAEEPLTERRVIDPVVGMVLVPGELYLMVTEEYTETHRHVPMLEGKSSVGRLGISIHVTAGKGDVGFCNHWTMEVTVIKPTRVYAGMPIGQLIYHTVDRQPDHSYGTKHGSSKRAAKYTTMSAEPQGSRMYRNLMHLRHGRKVGA